MGSSASLAGEPEWPVPCWPPPVHCGSATSLHALCSNSFQCVCILRDMKFHLPVLEIRFLECRGEPVLLGWGCQPSLALNLQPSQYLQFFLPHWLLLGVHWRKSWGMSFIWDAAGAGGSLPPAAASPPCTVLSWQIKGTMSACKGLR